MQQELHHEFKNFFDIAIDKNRTNSHGSLRTKTEYGFLSVSQIDKTNQELELAIFLPQISDCIFFCWSKGDGKELLYPKKYITRTQAFTLLRKALKLNEDNLPHRLNGFDTSKWEGVYLWRSRSEVGKDGIENFKKAFDGSIPQTFIDKCKKAKVTLKSYGKDPFKFSFSSLKEILN